MIHFWKSITTIYFLNIKVLLISSSRNNNNWIVPGGGIEDNENPEEAAAREVYEEAGVKGRLGRYLGIFEVRILKVVS